MRTGRPKTYAVTLSDDEREQLRPLAHSRSLPHALARRVKNVLMAADGVTNTAIGSCPC